MTRDPAFIIARLRSGRMIAATGFTGRQVDIGLSYIEAALSYGDTVNVTINERSDGLGVTDTDRKRLQRATRNRRA